MKFPLVGFILITLVSFIFGLEESLKIPLTIGLLLTGEIQESGSVISDLIDVAVVTSFFSLFLSGLFLVFDVVLRRFP